LFINAYFRRTTVAGCVFSGCRFVDCDFPKMSLSGSRLQYCKFQGCYIPYSQLRLNMPTEPNLREEIAHDLAVETDRMGAYSESTDFRWEEIRSHELNLSLAVRGATEWYRTHYDLSMRLICAVRLVSSMLNRHLWGYGEKIWILIRNLLLLSVVVFPVAFLFVRSGFTKAKGGSVEIADLIGYSLAHILPISIASGTSPVSPLASFLTTLESLAGFVGTGLFLSYLLRWISRR